MFNKYKMFASLFIRVLFVALIEVMSMFFMLSALLAIADGNQYCMIVYMTSSIIASIIALYYAW